MFRDDSVFKKCLMKIEKFKKMLSDDCKTKKCLGMIVPAVQHLNLLCNAGSLCINIVINHQTE